MHERSTRLPFILKRYNMQTSESIRSLRMGGSVTVSELQGTVFINAEMLEQVSGRLVGIFDAGQFFVAVLDSGLLLLTPAGEFIEFLPVTQLPLDQISEAGESPDGTPILLTGSAKWKPDPDWILFEEYTGSVVLNPVEWVELDRSASDAVLEAYNGRGPTIYRVLLDLHSGRLFGWGGRTVMDLAAVAIILLVISGLKAWHERSRGPTRRVRH